MEQNQNCVAPPGWQGGFAGSNPAFAYPDPDLSSLPMLDNMANIPLLRRQQGVEWPEFSWETIQGTPGSRCFQMFSPYISRIGYTDTGRVYSIICPQQGTYIPNKIVLNVEVTVTGQRGWVNETNQELAADMTVVGKIWFSASKDQSPLVKLAWDLFKAQSLPFPSNKANAIQVTTHKLDNPVQPIFPVRKGETILFKSPDFARHADKACAVGNVEVQIGPIVSLNNTIVDNFNKGVIAIFNIATGNMLQAGNLLSWNVWFAAPKLVDQVEWAAHAEKWRKSIDTGQGSPTGPGTPARYFNGDPFSPLKTLDQEFDDLFNDTIKMF
jgi:hypothetical protein